MTSKVGFLNAKGMTLIELVIAIAVAGIAVAGLAAAFSSIAGRTADPLIETQAQLIAESYLEEILLKPLADPNSGAFCASDAGESSTDRTTYDDACDYAALNNNAIEDQLGDPVDGLGAYSVTVSVVQSALGSLGGAGSDDSYLITVSVSTPIGRDLVLSAYRANYE